MRTLSQHQGAKRLAARIRVSERVSPVAAPVKELRDPAASLPAGTRLSLSITGANHDPAAYERPDELDTTVADRELHLSFGAGPHYCLGAGLARAELQEALPMLAAAMPDVELDGEPTWRPPAGIVGPETLPVRFSPRPAPQPA